MDNHDIVRKRAHLFTVEILIEDGSNGLAMEKLLHVLNHPNIRDYRITKGVELGLVIEEALKNHVKTNEDKKRTGALPKPQMTKLTPEPPSNTDERSRLIHLMTNFKEKGTLVRLTVVKGKGIKLNMPCRILNFDVSANNLTVYHVDEKKVFLFQLNEIEEIAAG